MSKNRNLILKLKGRFTKIPNYLWRLGPILTKEDRRVYPLAMAVYAVFAGSAETFHPGVRYLADQLGCAKDTVQRAIEFLVQKNMLILHEGKTGERNKFEFVHPDQWK